jgi:hypothetical protein
MLVDYARFVADISVVIKPKRRYLSEKRSRYSSKWMEHDAVDRADQEESQGRKCDREDRMSAEKTKHKL